MNVEEKINYVISPFFQKNMLLGSIDNQKVLFAFSWQIPRVDVPTLILSVSPLSNHRPGADELLHHV